MASILDTVAGSPQTQQAVDTITSILQQHAQPTVGDAAQATTQNLMGLTNPNDIKTPDITPQAVANKNAQEQIAAPASMLDIMQKAATAGNAQSSAILDTFKQFAPDPGDLGKLVQAAHEDPTQITPQNAASWAAQKAPQLGLGQLSSATKQASVDDMLAQTAQRRAIANSKNNPKANGVQSAEELPAVGPNGVISPPQGTVASLISAPAAGSVSPTTANTQIITKYQGATAPAGQMFVKQADGSVGLTPIPGSGNKSASPKPITSAQAGQLSMVKQGQDAIPEIKRLMFTDGSLDKDGNLKKGAALDRTALAQLTAVPFTNARPGIISPKARQLWTAIYNMTDAKLRLESGAAVPEPEVARTAQAYIASVIDTPETAIYKLQAPAKYFNDYMSLVGSTPGSVNNKPSPGVAQSYKDKYGLQ